MCRTPPACIEIRLIPNFQWSGIKLTVWLPTFLLAITCAIDVQMVHARPFSTSTLQHLSNDVKNTPMSGVLAPAIELWSFRSPRGLPSPNFENVSFILTLPSKWGCDTLCGWTNHRLYARKNLGKRMHGKLRHIMCDAGVGWVWA
jgi:hypothetical protein